MRSSRVVKLRPSRKLLLMKPTARSTFPLARGQYGGQATTSKPQCSANAAKPGWTRAGASSLRALGHDLLEVVEDQLPGDATQLVKRTLEKLDEHRTPLRDHEPAPDHAGVAQHHHQQAEASPPAVVEDGPAGRPVHLSLAAGRGLEAVHQPAHVSVLDRGRLLREGSRYRLRSHAPAAPSAGPWPACRNARACPPGRPDGDRACSADGAATTPDRPGAASCRGSVGSVRDAEQSRLSVPPPVANGASHRPPSLPWTWRPPPAICRLHQRHSRRAPEVASRCQSRVGRARRQAPRRGLPPHHPPGPSGEPVGGMGSASPTQRSGPGPPTGVSNSDRCFCPSYDRWSSAPATIARRVPMGGPRRGPWARAVRSGLPGPGGRLPRRSLARALFPSRPAAGRAGVRTTGPRSGPPLGREGGHGRDSREAFTEQQQRLGRRQRKPRSGCSPPDETRSMAQRWARAVRLVR